jgi:hypothetical protein
MKRSTPTRNKAQWPVKHICGELPLTVDETPFNSWLSIDEFESFSVNVRPCLFFFVPANGLRPGYHELPRCPGFESRDGSSEEVLRLLLVELEHRDLGDKLVGQLVQIVYETSIETRLSSVCGTHLGWIFRKRSNHLQQTKPHSIRD